MNGRNKVSSSNTRNVRKIMLLTERMELIKVEIEVSGQPQGKGRPRFTRNGRAYTPDKTREYEATE